MCVEMCLPALNSWCNSHVNQMLPENTFTRIQGTLLEWRAQYRLMDRSTEETSSSGLVVSRSSAPAPEKRMDQLDRRIDVHSFHPRARFLQRFERGFQDLILLEASYLFKDEKVLAAHVFQFKDTLRHLTMNRLVFSYGFLSSRLLIQILRTCTTLQTLEFNATKGFTLDQMLAILQKRHVDF